MGCGVSGLKQTVPQVRCRMKPRSAFLFVAACIVAALVLTFVLSRPTCTCVLGHHYDSPSDPADCAVHGSLVP